MHEQALLLYQNRTSEAIQVINELIQIAIDLRAGDVHAKELGLTDDEVAFYDALAAKESAIQVSGDGTLEIIAREALRIVRENATIDWNVWENIQANLRKLVKHVLRHYGYPPDKKEIATQTVIQQVQLISGKWLKLSIRM
jgi:type I restriction enzyme R subunit